MQTKELSIEDGTIEISSSIPPKAVHVGAFPWRFRLFLSLFLGISLVVYVTCRFDRLSNFDSIANLPASTLPCEEDPSMSNHSLVTHATTITWSEWIWPSRTNLLHNMSDEEVFRRATITSDPVNNSNYKHLCSRRKIAFMFLTKGPMPLAPLWERFFKGHEGFYSIYIHALPSYHGRFWSTSVFYKRNVPSKVAEWGEISMIDAERKLLANALLDISNEWFIFLSESCIPIFNFNGIYEYITNSQLSFVDAFDDKGPYGRGRYNNNMAPLFNITQWRKGSQWFQVNRRLAYEIVTDSIYYLTFKQFCKPSCYPDEHYIPTMLHIVAPTQIANRTLTSADWSRGGYHPATFGKDDHLKAGFFKRFSVEDKCFGLNNSTGCFLFARKFSPSALGPLLSLASEAFHY